MNITANVGFLGTLYSYTGSKHVSLSENSGSIWQNLSYTHEG